MILYIFNPEHDLALASNLSNFTAPHAGRLLRHDLGFLPAIWTVAEDDTVVVDDVEEATKRYQKLRHALKSVLEPSDLPLATPRFSTASHLVASNEAASSIQPWGWDLALKAWLLRKGCPQILLPTDDEISVVRQLSHRQCAASLLAQLQREGTTGEACLCRTEEDVLDRIGSLGEAVLKAPYSSSGRGVRFVTMQPIESQKSQNDLHWLRNVLDTQGAVMLEPYYNKVKDFAMEFYSDGLGNVSYLGLSLFHTENGAYKGNILATEQTKRSMISRYLPMNLVDEVQSAICQILGDRYKGCYRGPFGVDMMIVANADGFLFHPCVEINLRCTMGHVAIRLSPRDEDHQHVMSISYSNNNYKLNISRL